jgi:glutamyl-Q tRNA(Asp) synthetase
MASYLGVAGDLFAREAAFYCRCSRQQIRHLTGNDRYPGTCRDRHLPAGDAALRFRVSDGATTFIDGLRGRISRRVADSDGDFVIVRRDGLPAYHLAVVVDDADQDVSDIVRGADLLDSTALHICLQRRLGLPTPRYWHIPVITNDLGEKLSKGAGAAAVDDRQPSASVIRVLRLLGLEAPRELTGARPRELWQWAERHWRIEVLAGRDGIVADAP